MHWDALAFFELLLRKPIPVHFPDEKGAMPRNCDELTTGQMSIGSPTLKFQVKLFPELRSHAMSFLETKDLLALANTGHCPREEVKIHIERKIRESIPAFQCGQFAFTFVLNVYFLKYLRIGFTAFELNAPWVSLEDLVEVCRMLSYDLNNELFISKSNQMRKFLKLEPVWMNLVVMEKLKWYQICSVSLSIWHAYRVYSRNPSFLSLSICSVKDYSSLIFITRAR